MVDSGIDYTHPDLYQNIWLNQREIPTALRTALTDAELTVLEQLPSGRTALQIAQDLGVSINTVKTHLRAIYAKLGANSRADAMLRARRIGLL